MRIKITGTLLGLLLFTPCIHAMHNVTSSSADAAIIRADGSRVSYSRSTQDQEQKIRAENTGPKKTISQIVDEYLDEPFVWSQDPETIAITRPVFFTEGPGLKIIKLDDGRIVTGEPEENIVKIVDPTHNAATIELKPNLENDVLPFFSGVTCLATINNKLLAGFNRHSTLVMWDLNDLNKEPAQASDLGLIQAIEPLADGKIAIASLESQVSSQSTIRIIDLSKLTTQAKFYHKTRGATALIRELADGKIACATERHVEIFDRQLPNEHPFALYALGTEIRGLLPIDGTRIITSSRDYTAKLWHLEEEKNALTLPLLEPDDTWFFHRDTMNPTLFRLNNGHIACCSWDGILRIWDPKDFSQSRRFIAPKFGSTSNVLQLPDGKLVSTSGGLLKLWPTLGQAAINTLSNAKKRRDFEEIIYALQHKKSPYQDYQEPIQPSPITDLNVLKIIASYLSESERTVTLAGIVALPAKQSAKKSS